MKLADGGRLGTMIDSKHLRYRNLHPEGFPKYRPLPEGVKGKERNPRTARRAFFHDYCAPGHYLITATEILPADRAEAEASCTSHIMPLCTIPFENAEENLRQGSVSPILSPLGQAIEAEILSIPSFHPEMEILRYAIMPDHIHIVLWVKRRIKRKLGRELAPFFGACSKHFTRLIGSDTLFTLFYPFHDRIIFDQLQLDRSTRYVDDNPRRYLIKKLHPDLFRRYLHLEIGEREYAGYGNIFLLRQPYLLQVRIHRRWSENEFEDYNNFCMAEIDKGAIPVSPAIHPAEKKIMRYAIDSGSSVIFLTDQGFEERFKPKGERFDLCAEGRLLLLAPWPENIGRKSTSGYKEFHSMNDMAKELVELPANTRLILKGNPN